MPIFEYQCKKCGKEFERILKTREEAPGGCPQCGGTDLKKLFSKAAVKVAGAKQMETPLPPCGKGGTCCGSNAVCDTPHCES